MYQLSDRDMATILAALRHWQATVNDDERKAFPHFAEDIEPLSDAEPSWLAHFNLSLRAAEDSGGWQTRYLRAGAEHPVRLQERAHRQ